MSKAQVSVNPDELASISNILGGGRFYEAYPVITVGDGGISCNNGQFIQVLSLKEKTREEHCLHNACYRYRL